GNLVWDSPVYTGDEDITADEFKLIYNIAMNIEEWRNGIKIGNIVRDMQIEVYHSDNRPPTNPLFGDFCVEAGSLIEFNITSTDIDNDPVTHEASGGAFVLGESPAEFFEIDSDSGSVTSTFRWQTECSHVRDQPYSIVIKVEDNNSELSLVDIDHFNITVLGPAPENVTPIPTSDYIRLHWSPNVCDNIKGYRIYRRIGNVGFTPDTCENGVPEYTGYKVIGETDGWNDTIFIDNGGGEGLMKGTEYCYMVVALYEDGTESFASDEVCSILIEGLPVITNVSVIDTDTENGSIYVAWAKPDPDTLQIKYGASGPFKYLIYRADGIWGNNFVQLDSVSSPDLEDTIYIDTYVGNTAARGYIYRIELINDGVARFRIGSPDEASSVFLKIDPGDNKLILHAQKNVPWINYQFVIYKQNPVTLDFDSLAATVDSISTDSDLVNGITYCYKIKTIGTYSRSNIIDPIINFSQENCAIPDDADPPCPPFLTVVSNCDSLYNELSWTRPELSCGEDVVGYNLYYHPFDTAEMALLDVFSSPDDTTYIHRPELTLSGHYAVTAVDSFANESGYSLLRLRVDTCTYFEIPNVFTPNGDNINDILKSNVFQFVSRIDMKIYDRTGNLVFETQEPEINWDGMYNGKYVTPGVYYYICDVYEYRSTGHEEVRNITGFIHVITDKGARIPDEK
ncbi:MAG: gliding motility-associated C-terminal domain-containing protein, partial [Bacteroidales bacterium]